MTRRSWPLLTLLILAATGCRAASGAAGGGNDGSDGSMVRIEGANLTGNLLDGLRLRVPAMLVTTRAGECPLIMFRGQRSMTTQGNPSVYVDGTLMGDTCPLTQISTGDVLAVEVYPGGITSRAGVRRNPFGIIMVFRNRV